MERCLSWFKVPVSKIGVDVMSTVGSNPTLSAKFIIRSLESTLVLFFIKKVLTSKNRYVMIIIVG